jgi:hypothetical protein
MAGELEGKVAVVTWVVSGTRREGGLKEQLLRKASQLQTASQISLWLSSPIYSPHGTNKSSHPGVDWNG